MMMTARQAERCAQIAWEAFCSLTSSEVAAQEAIGGTPKDFELYALRYLIQVFMTGQLPRLSKRIDATAGDRNEDQTGDYHFDQPANLEAMTYSQAIMGLQEQVPSAELRLKFKQLHARGEHSPYQAYKVVMDQWAEMKSRMVEAVTAD